MRRQSHALICLVSIIAVVSTGLATAPAFARHRIHKHPAPGATADHRSLPQNEQPGDGPLPGPRGPFVGADGIFSPQYEVPGREVYHLGGELLGGSFGKAYEDYYRHYYYYKYAYCPLGTSYVIYLRRCVGPFDLFR